MNGSSRNRTSNDGWVRPVADHGLAVSVTDYLKDKHSIFLDSRNITSRANTQATTFLFFERIRDDGVSITQVMCAGGIVEKNLLRTQTYADVTDCTMLVAGESALAFVGLGNIGAKRNQSINPI